MNFDMKYVGHANVIVGIKILRTDRVALSQSQNVEKVLRKFYFLECKPMSTHYDPCIKSRKNGGDSVSQLRYSQLIGTLRYYFDYTRLDIANAVGRLSRCAQNPNEYHRTTVGRVLRYLKGTSHYVIHYT